MKISTFFKRPARWVFLFTIILSLSISKNLKAQVTIHMSPQQEEIVAGLIGLINSFGLPNTEPMVQALDEMRIAALSGNSMAYNDAANRYRLGITLLPYVPRMELYAYIKKAEIAMARTEVTCVEGEYCSAACPIGCCTCTKENCECGCKPDGTPRCGPPEED